VSLKILAALGLAPEAVVALSTFPEPIVRRRHEGEHGRWTVLRLITSSYLVGACTGMLWANSWTLSGARAAPSNENAVTSSFGYGAEGACDAT